MSCASPNTVLRLTFLIITLIVSCALIVSAVWLFKIKATSGQYESYYLARINVTKSQGSKNLTVPTSDHQQDMIKIEIAMRRVEENSRRLKEYTKSLLWHSKDKSLWCVLFKDDAVNKSTSEEKSRHSIDEDYIRTLREQKMKDPVIHLRHHGIHHRKRLDSFPNTPYVK